MGEETTEPDSTEGIDAEHADDVDLDSRAEAEAEAGAEVESDERADGDAGGDDDRTGDAEDADGADDDADADADDVSGVEGDAAPPADSEATTHPHVVSAAEPAPAEQLWDAIASAALLRAQPQFDETVLDAWCGDGAAALPTAALVGPFGRVDAVDPDERLVALARERANGQLPQLHVEVADPAEWATTGYDLVQCVLGLASCDTPDETARHLVSLAKPGGRVVIALWAHDAFASLDDLARTALAAETAGSDGEADASEEPADEASAPLPGTSGTLAALLHELGLAGVRAERVDRHAELDADLAWRLVVSARRVPIEELDEATTERVRQRFIDALGETDLEHVDVSTLIAVGRRPE
jgi:SAM-dependent methyltransferase